VVHPHGVDGHRIPTTIEAMAEQRLAAVCELQPHGPYVIGGYCNGALVAFAMAQALRARGEAVERLIMVDPPSITGSLGGLKQALTRGSAWATGDPLLAMKYVYRVVEFAQLPLRQQLRTVWNKLRRVSTSEMPPSERDLDPTPEYSVVIRTYVPHRYDGPVSVVASETEAERVAAWKRWCPRAELTVTAGTHQNCTTTFVHALAERLGRVLEVCR
jgi:thioesterase domain-containing protein